MNDPAPLHPDPEIAALLDFQPARLTQQRVNGWDAEAQRAYVVALVATGSKSGAAHAIRMAANGAERVRKLKGA